jgi:tetratricopeptide (TPR) repeat protein
MLVLESEWDYQRFGLDRRALASILTVDAGGIGVIDRRNPNLPAPVAIPTRPIPVEKSRAEAPASGWMTMAPPSPSGPPANEPEAMAAPRPASVAESITITAEAPALAFAAPQQELAPPAPAPPPAHIQAPPSPRPPAPPARVEEQKRDVTWTKPLPPSRDEVEALQGKLAADPRDRGVYNKLSDALVARGEWTPLRSLALKWQPYDPENPQVYEVLGLADEHLGNDAEAARAEASLIEIAAAKPELLQRAGLLLLRTHHAALAETPLRRALELRPDRANGYRHLALMLWREGRFDEAARVLESATRQQFPQWYLNVQRVIREELGYVYRAWLAKEPSRRDEIERRARDYNVDLARRDALRVTLAWETDANDVDLHVVDPKGEECYYQHKATASGLELYEDVTQGLGPEVIRTATLEKGTYTIGANYFAAGPMGISRGIVVVMRNDDVDIYPFRLIEDNRGAEMRYIAAVTVK